MAAPLRLELYGRVIAVPNPSKQARLRWLGQMSPEPETVAWIESMEPGKHYFDVGANVGTFAMRAALRGLVTTVFEPVEENLRELAEVFRVNNVPVNVYRGALYSSKVAGYIAPGRSNWMFFEGPTARHASIESSTLDDFLNLTPAYIKIDVDGNELDVLKGGEKTLDSSELLSVLIEIDPGVKNHSEIVPLMKSHGFSYSDVQVEACRVRGGKYDGLANYIFRRQDRMM